MATPRRRPTGGEHGGGHPTRRADLLSQLRRSADRYAAHRGGGQLFVDRAARVEAGEAVRVWGWEVSDPPSPSSTHYALEADGSLTPLTKRKVGTTVYFHRPDGTEVR